MIEFKYNPDTLDESQREAIASAKKDYNEKIEYLQKQEDERAERYYNCEDDYSYGGPCSKANERAQSRAWNELQEAIEMIVRDGYIIRSRRHNLLRDLKTGECVAINVHEGRYGRYFVTLDGKFISCAKRVSTYNKKGVSPIVQTVTEKLLPDGYWSNGERRYKHLDYISITEEVSTEIVY